MAEPTLPFELQEKILQLEKHVKERLPNMPFLLREIWQALDKDPDNVTLLKEEQIQIIVSGLEKQTDTYIVSNTVKSKSAVSKLKNLQADDI
jgi:hypothetical protein